MDESTVLSILTDGEIHRVFDVITADESASVEYPPAVVPMVGYPIGRIARIGLTVMWTTGPRQIEIHDHVDLDTARECYAGNLASWQELTHMEIPAELAGMLANFTGGDRPVTVGMYL